MLQTLKRIIFNPIFGYSLIAVLLGASLVYGASVTDYRTQLVNNSSKWKTEEKQQGNIFDGLGRMITAEESEKSKKFIEIDKRNQKMMVLDTEIKAIKKEIDAIDRKINGYKDMQQEATETASDLRLKVSVTEDNLQKYDAFQGFQREPARQ